MTIESTSEFAPNRAVTLAKAVGGAGLRIVNLYGDALGKRHAPLVNFMLGPGMPVEVLPAAEQPTTPVA